MLSDVSKRVTQADREAARADWELEHPGAVWSEVRTQTKNRLAREQVFHREFAELCAAIKRG